MKIDLEKVQIGPYDVREEEPEEHIEELKESLDTEGQINPIIVRPDDDGQYIVIAGHSRVRAARELGWDTIDAQVREIDDEAADRLSLTSNLFRKEMSNLEQGKVLKKLIDDHDYTYGEIADKIGKSESWVARRVRVALNVHPDVAEALEEEKINIEAAYEISSLEEEEQKQLLDRILDKGVSRAQDIRREKKWIKNNTIHTIGYSGKDFDSFVEQLKDNNIDKVIDTRHSTDSQYKPEFNGDVLGRQLKQEGIQYEHRKDLGVPYIIQTPYKEGVISDECFKNFYQWHVKENNEVDLEELIEEIKETGDVALLCMEEFAQPRGDQDHYCHRNFLAEMLMETGFAERNDI